MALVISAGMNRLSQRDLRIRIHLYRPHSAISDDQRKPDTDPGSVVITSCTNSTEDQQPHGASALRPLLLDQRPLHLIQNPEETKTHDVRL